ncbi:unnamed protein product, partial [Didymodactylos carnosus]
AGLSGSELGLAGGSGAGYGASSSYESYGSSGSGLGGGDFGGAGGVSGSYGSSSFESSGGYGSGSLGQGGNSVDFAAAAFQAADKNKDGSVDAHEFRDFVGQNVK